jgi:16S rRNA (cytosine967-C5)-methyltransferase
MIAPARIAAYEILSAVSAERADLPSAIAHARDTLDDDRDRGLAAEIATGVQRWRARLDHLIAHYARRPIARLDPQVLEILRLSVYQLGYLSRVPASAVVDDAVKLTRRVRKKSATGLVNGVLRAMSRGRQAWPIPPRPGPDASRDAQLEYLTIAQSHPRWLAERWLDRLGFERADAWTTFNNRPSPLTLRANRRHVSPEALQARLGEAQITTRPTRFAPDGLIVEDGQPLRDPVHLEGLFVVQDESSQLVTLLAGEHPGPRVLDVCASPGGKTTAFAATDDATLVVACDVRDRRMALLRQTVTNADAQNVRLVQADALRTLPFRGVFSTVVVDAPCSGLGTLRRDPDIRWRRTVNDLRPLAAEQLTMLRRAADAVAPGGRLIYATCSSEPEENEDVAAHFIGDAPDFRTVDAGHAHPRLDAALIDPRGHFRTEPDRHGLEAFFGAVFERTRKL